MFYGEDCSNVTFYDLQQIRIYAESPATLPHSCRT